MIKVLCVCYGNVEMSYICTDRVSVYVLSEYRFMYLQGTGICTDRVPVYVLTEYRYMYWQSTGMCTDRVPVCVLTEYRFMYWQSTGLCTDRVPVYVLTEYRYMYWQNTGFIPLDHSPSLARPRDKQQTNHPSQQKWPAASETVPCKPPYDHL